MAQGCDHTQDAASGLTGAALGSRLAAAEALCARRDQRLTPPRRRVLELLLEAGQPLKAYDLMAAYEAGAPAKPPTVYRALDFLEREGFAHRIESLNAFVACGHPLSGDAGVHAAAFLICDCCGAAREIEPRLGEALPQQARDAGYEIQAVTVEAHGLCQTCRSA
ncbi:MAG: Fur family transcriptional regulator [Caulobacteraceae bacterium]|nr:Fur family transcriptional regulator [Caulobacteraceae bacterium]